MAENIVESLFGPTPFQIQQQQNAALNQAADTYAMQDPFQRAAGSMYRAGGMLGGAAMEGMGYQNPAIEQAKMREQQLADIDLSTSKGVLTKALQTQDPRLKAHLIVYGRQLQAKEQEAALAMKKDTREDVKMARDAVWKHEENLARLEETSRANRTASEDRRLSIEQRDVASRRADATDRIIAQMMADSRRSAAEAKASAPKPISTVDARSIDKSMAASSGANAAMQLLDQADALYGQYTSGRDEPILGGVARWGAAVGLADPKRAADYEVGTQIAKDLGVIKLGLIGGSDTERELQIAIDTSPSPDKLPSTNRAITANQRRAIEILQSEPDFKTEWVNRNGSLSKLDKDSGEPYGKAWRKYQLANFKPVVIPSNAGTSKAGKSSNVDGIPTGRTFKVLGKEPG